MNRFDDKLSWRFLEKFIAPVVSVLLAYIVFRVNLEHRITIVETNQESMHGDIQEIKNDVKALLARGK